MRALDPGQTDRQTDKPDGLQRDRPQGLPWKRANNTGGQSNESADQTGTKLRAELGFKHAILHNNRQCMRDLSNAGPGLEARKSKARASSGTRPSDGQRTIW